MKTKIPLAEAEQLANHLLAYLSPYCTRIEIAGSIRRRKPCVGDVEIVCIPKITGEKNLFGELIQARNELEYPLNKMSLSGWQFIKDGPRFKQLISPDGISLDLFICLPPAQWGVLFTLRTGPSDFSTWIVTQRNKGGALPSDLHVSNGAVWRGGVPIHTPEEDDFLRLCGLDGTPPSERCPGMPVRRTLVSQ